MMEVVCPDCGEVVAVPAHARPGDLLDCPSCPGHPLRLACIDERWSATGVPRDSWLALGIAGTLLACVACLTPALALALGAIGLGAWTGRLDTVMVLLLVGFAALTAYRYWSRRRRP